MGRKTGRTVYFDTPRPLIELIVTSIVVPLVATIIAVITQALVTGELDRAELATAVGGLLTSALVYLVPNAKSDGPPS